MDCANGEVGRIYEGLLDFDKNKSDLCRTQSVFVNIAFVASRGLHVDKSSQKCSKNEAKIEPKMIKQVLKNHCLQKKLQHMLQLNPR